MFDLPLDSMATLLLTIVSLALIDLAACQVAFDGRFFPVDGSQSSTSLPTAVSWPASQIKASFIGSSAVTAVVKDLTYTTESDILLLAPGVSLVVDGAGEAVMTSANGLLYFTIGDLPPNAATVTLIKEDEPATGTCNSGFVLEQRQAQYASVTVRTSYSADVYDGTGSLEFVGFNLDGSPTARSVCKSRGKRGSRPDHSFSLTHRAMEQVSAGARCTSSPDGVRRRQHHCASMCSTHPDVSGLFLTCALHRWALATSETKRPARPKRAQVGYARVI